MKATFIALGLIVCLFCCIEVGALDIRDAGPSGKNWKQVADGYYINIKNVKRINATVYQIEFCNSVRGASWWNYFTDRIDCNSGMTWTLNTSTKEWVGPLTPSDYHKASASVVCKKKK